MNPNEMQAQPEDLTPDQSAASLALATRLSEGLMPRGPQEPEMAQGEEMGKEMMNPVSEPEAEPMEPEMEEIEEEHMKNPMEKLSKELSEFKGEMKQLIEDKFEALNKKT